MLKRIPECENMGACEMDERGRPEFRVCCVFQQTIKQAIHFTDKLYTLEREKEKRYKSMEMSQTACRGWNSVWTEIGTKNQIDPERG
ncbi:hypothetical protein AVEN_114142-1 [Araneus ventricosus]|uniref:Uncharacterized protein n=1 Tax=Araneus ventricosus TaxID=182803 RepID=A0A4Y2Q6B8_ARAVE|nr:hypothetical protein AVEN_273592-1 [Araneus ventricosus]GBN57792.1 hypothetical protein AVEN_221167-1 [Araneus ventricosus]GBN57836.1 hypothetical protein AVEN_166123-1 [Araneus ventricosus]GBN57872.1 hypothetical protein AVEN_114142-1 [Araneus ventricosus]